MESFKVTQASQRCRSYARADRVFALRPVGQHAFSTASGELFFKIQTSQVIR